MAIEAMDDTALNWISRYRDRDFRPASSGALLCKGFGRNRLLVVVPGTASAATNWVFHYEKVEIKHKGSQRLSDSNGKIQKIGDFTCNHMCLVVIFT